MPTEPLSGSTYNGFSGPYAAPQHPEPGRPAGQSISRNTLIAGVGAAVAAGLAFGLWARPGGEARQPMQNTPPAAEAPAAKVPVELAVPPPPEPVKADGPLEVLPEDLARAAEARRPVAPAPAVRLPAPAPVITPAPQPAPAPERDIAEAVPAPRPQTQPSFQCRYAGTRAERMICGDEQLATLDRRLDRAFDRAVSSGVPYRALRNEQDDWLSIREDAARRSPEAVASVYRQRIRELNAIADEGRY